MALREKRGKLHQAAAARRIGIGKGELSRYENDRTAPGAAALEKILACYGVDLVDLLFSAAEKPEENEGQPQSVPVSPEDAQGALRDHEEMLRREVEDLRKDVEDLRRNQDEIRRKMDRQTQPA